MIPRVILAELTKFLFKLKNQGREFITKLMAHLHNRFTKLSIKSVSFGQIHKYVLHTCDQRLIQCKPTMHCRHWKRTYELQIITDPLLIFLFNSSVFKVIFNQSKNDFNWNILEQQVYWMLFGNSIFCCNNH